MSASPPSIGPPPPPLGPGTSAVPCPACGRPVAASDWRCFGCRRIVRPIGAPDGVTFLYAGDRYFLGQGDGYYGVWDLTAEGGPLQRFSMTTDGWHAVWATYSTLEQSLRAPTAAGADQGTGQVATSTSSPHTAVRLAIGLGAAAVAISPFLAWVRFALLGDLTLFDLLRLAGDEPGLAWPVVAMGVAVAFTTLRAKRPEHLRTYGIAFGILGLVASAYGMAGLANDVSRAGGFANLALGGWVAIAGSVSMLAGGLASRD